MTVDPFPTSAAPLRFHVNEAALTDGMAALADLPSFFNLCAGLVDLTDDPALPPYAGMNDTEMLYAGSLLKIVPMYAAFELRSRVRKHVAEAIDAGLSTDAPGWEHTVIADLQQAWQPTLDATFPDLPAGFPQLARIFAFSPGGSVEFTQASPALSDAHIDGVIGEFGRPQGGFLDWMRSMLRQSNNTAASHCIRALSFPYLNGVLLGAELIDRDLQNGLWVSGDYLGQDWIPNTPGRPQANRAGRPLSPRWATAQKRQTSNFTATAAQVATMMALLATDQLVEPDPLVDPTPNGEMRDLMTGVDGIGSYIHSSLDGDGRASDRIISKIGFGDDSRSHDCAIVERTAPSGKPLRYVVVGLGSAAGSRRDLDDLFIQLDELIVQRYP